MFEILLEMVKLNTANVKILLRCNFYYLVLVYLVTPGCIHAAGIPHIGDLFRILNHVELPIPSVDSFPPILPFQVTPGKEDDQKVPPILELDDIRLYIIDEDNPTLKQEVSRRNYLGKMTRGWQIYKDDVDSSAGVLSQNESLKEVSQRVVEGTTEREVGDETADENEVEGVGPEKRRQKLKVIIHGWGESANKAWYAEMTAAYMLKESSRKQGLSRFEIKEELKVLQVDWSVQAAAEYSSASVNTQRVGQYVGKFIADLHWNLGYSLDDIHVIGHSLGGQIAGFIGKEVLKLTGQPIGRISALDPAGPLFEFPLRSPDKRLVASDAKFVDVVHTDGGYFGCKLQMGSVDFYPNGGIRPQPGCNDINNWKLNLDDVFAIAFCSHTRSYHYFIESIGDDSIMEGTKCNSWDDYKKQQCSGAVKIKFGEEVPYNAEKGSYFFATNSRPPFGKPVE